MLKHLSLLILAVCLALPISAQTKKIKNLKNQKAQMERTLKKTKTDLAVTKKSVGQKEARIDFLENQLQSRLTYIHQLEADITRIEVQIDTLKAEAKRLESQLEEKKKKYKHSLRMARSSSALHSPSLFILSAPTFRQMNRRMRYAREYASYQKQLGLEVMDQQNRVRDNQAELLQVKQQHHAVVQEVIKQRRALAREQSVEQKNVVTLRKKQKEMEQRVSEQQKQINALNKKIDELIAYEIEQARRRAEEKARREAEERRRREAAASKGKSGKSKGSKGKTTPLPSSSPTKWLTAREQKLDGSFQQNKGRLPVPITGPYRIGNRFGLYQVAGLSGVTLDNKGVNYIGQAGARARAVFDGEVSAVFALGSTKNVLVRHGSYITVYCNLSSVIVSRGAQVKARDILGTVAEDASGVYVLHFQLRKERQKLNPESWIGR
ncbi:MAG: peptidoglycan DD-metalloendopeptidase family protein [Bacteroidaceae bacterium]|nr:peptidoglycan DD-metalloendopeptidase family protein [Bacteroidaceae bacterium]